MKRLPIILLLAVSIFSLTACGSVRNTWKGTKKVFYNYLDTDPSIDFSYEGTSNPGLVRLAKSVAPLDEKVQRMVRLLETQDTLPEKSWCDEFIAAHPWINGITVLTQSGQIVYNAPPFMLKKLDFGPLLDVSSRYAKRWSAGHVMADDLGSELIVAQPYYNELTHEGIIAVNFDPASLAKLSPQSDEFVIFTPDGGILWNGANAGAASSLAGLQWKNILKGAVYGEVSAGGGKFYWMVRYLGNLPIIYAVDAKPLPPKPKPGAKPAEAQPEPQAAPAEQGQAQPAAQ